MTELALTVSRRIAAPPERVFAAWLDPQALARFMLPTDDATVPRAVTDPRPGGRFEVIMRTGGRDLPHTGTYLEIDPPRRLVFTWESAHSVDDSTVTLTFVPASAGAATDVTLKQVTFLDATERDAHERGWTAVLAALASTFALPQGATP
jgi:uncharacterized protein YndB with AHSA1/START domain